MNDTLTLEETPSGELFFEVPDEILDTLGWDDGTLLEWSVVGDTIRISKSMDTAQNYGEELPEQSRVVRTPADVERRWEEVESGDGAVVGEPSY